MKPLPEHGTPALHPLSDHILLAGQDSGLKWMSIPKSLSSLCLHRSLQQSLSERRDGVVTGVGVLSLRLKSRG